jgi:V8-like Glu-specific endopeptidase
LNANTVITAAHCSVSSVIGTVSGLRVRAGSNVSFPLIFSRTNGLWTSL